MDIAGDNALLDVNHGLVSIMPIIWALERLALGIRGLSMSQFTIQTMKDL